MERKRKAPLSYREAEERKIKMLDRVSGILAWIALGLSILSLVIRCY